MGLGAYPAIELKEAREVATELYKKIKADPTHDPIIERNKAIERAKLEQQENQVTFKWCAEQFIESKTPEWNNPKSPQQWTNTLATYAFPFIGDYPVKEINTELIMRVLKPIWTTKTETATRVRGRIENILSWAAVQGYRAKDNPALWKGHLENLLAKPSKVKKVKPHKALAYKEINTFISELRTHKSMSAYALEVLILTATRTSEITGAIWTEIDFEEAMLPYNGIRFILIIVLTLTTLLSFGLLFLLLKLEENFKNTLKKDNEELEKKIMQRTRLISSKSKKISDLLDNAKEGFLSFGLNFYIDNEYSKECENIFEKSLIGENILELLWGNNEHKKEFFKEHRHDYYELIFITSGYGKHSIDLALIKHLFKTYSFEASSQLNKTLANINLNGEWTGDWDISFNEHLQPVSLKLLSEQKFNINVSPEPEPETATLKKNTFSSSGNMGKSRGSGSKP